MKIDGLNINLLASSLTNLTNSIRKEEKRDLSALNREDPSKRVESLSEGINDRKKDNNVITSYKAFFALDENKNVIIKVVDNDGNLIRQIPPEEYLKMVESLKMISEKLLHLEV